MNDLRFWGIIDQCRKECLGHAKKIPELLQSKLLPLPISEVLEFDTIFVEWLEKSFSNELWQVYYVATGWNNLERFDNFRAWLIITGKDYLERVLETPEILLHGFSSYGAEFIGRKVKETTWKVLALHPYTDELPKLALDYSHQYVPIGNPVSYETYKQLRDKYICLAQVYQIEEVETIASPYLEMDIMLMENLADAARLQGKHFTSVIIDALDSYIWQFGGGS